MPSENPYEAPPPLGDDPPVIASTEGLSTDLLWARGSTIQALGYAQAVVAVVALGQFWPLFSPAPELVYGVLAIVGVFLLHRWARWAQVILSCALLVTALAAIGSGFAAGYPLLPGLFCAIVQIGTLYLLLSRTGRALYAGDPLPASVPAGLRRHGFPIDGRLGVLLFKLVVLLVIELAAFYDLGLALDILANRPLGHGLGG